MFVFLSLEANINALATFLNFWIALGLGKNFSLPGRRDLSSNSNF